METGAKRKISNISAVAIIFPRSNPSQIFIEMKDDGYPMAAFRRQLCFIGGNWIGDNAKNDQNPLATVRREINEELALDQKPRSSEELVLLGLVDSAQSDEVKRGNVVVTDIDRKKLAEVRQDITNSLIPFGDVINTVPKSVLDAADPKNTRDGYAGLSSYYLAPLSDSSWLNLVFLQRAFGNLSNESVTLITTLEEIIEKGIKTAFGHDRVLQRFFRTNGFARSVNLPLVEGITSEGVGKPLPTYADYLDRYDIAKKPTL